MTPRLTPVIDRTSSRRPALSTGPPPAGSRYRPDLFPQTRVIDRTSPGRLPLSTGPPPAGSRYRPDLPRKAPVIDRTSPGRPALSTGPPPADPRYRPDLLRQTRVIDRTLTRQTRVIDRTSPGRPALSTGPPPADPRYRPDLPRQTRVIDRTSSGRLPLSTGVPRSVRWPVSCLVPRGLITHLSRFAKWRKQPTSERPTSHEPNRRTQIPPCFRKTWRAASNRLCGGTRQAPGWRDLRNRRGRRSVGCAPFPAGRSAASSPPTVLGGSEEARRPRGGAEDRGRGRRPGDGRDPATTRTPVTRTAPALPLRSGISWTLQRRGASPTAPAAAARRGEEGGYIPGSRAARRRACAGPREEERCSDESR